MTDQPITLADIDASDAICAAATDGPWEEFYDGLIIRVGEDESPSSLLYARCDDSGKDNDAEFREKDDAVFAAHARTALPRANAEIRRLRAETDRLRDAGRKMAGFLDRLKHEQDCGVGGWCVCHARGKEDLIAAWEAANGGSDAG